MEQLQIVFEFWRMMRRRMTLIATISVLGIAATLLFAFILPAKYRAEARILVERQQIPDQLARSTVTVDVGTRLQQIQARLMAHDNMARMIDEMDLYDDRPDLELYEKVDLFRWATRFKTTNAPQPGRNVRNVDISAFNIIVTYTDAKKSADIANAFVTQVLELNLGVRKEQATETLGFFVAEERRLARSLAEVETRITQFKRENEDTLPDSLDYRRDELSRLADQILELDRRILELEDMRSQLIAELSQLAEGTGAPTESPGAVELRRLQALLIQKKTIFSDTHREVVQLNGRIKALEEALGVVQNDGAPQSEAMAIREKGLRDRIALIDTQILTMRDQIAAAERQQTDILATIEDTPKIEMRLNGLERRHTELQEQYANAVRKRAEAETGERLELNQQSERFEVIENALLPEAPVSPNRKKIILMGSVASLGLALGLAFLLDLIRPVIRSPAQMQRALDLRPVVSIPTISTRADRQRALMKSIFWILFLGLAIPGALYLFDQHIMPLELLFEKLIERSGASDFLRLLQQRF